MKRAREETMIEYLAPNGAAWCNTSNAVSQQITILENQIKHLKTKIALLIAENIRLKEQIQCKEPSDSVRQE